MDYNVYGRDAHHCIVMPVAIADDFLNGSEGLLGEVLVNGRPMFGDETQAMGTLKIVFLCYGYHILFVGHKKHLIVLISIFVTMQPLLHMRLWL